MGAIIGKVFAAAISPDGTLIAAGGWTRWTELDPSDDIYLFDRATGALAHRITGLPTTVNDLAFSPDGRRLAAALNGPNGLRLYAAELDWAEVAQDASYGGSSYGIAFASDGRVATTSLDGQLRLYEAGLAGNVAQRLH